MEQKIERIIFTETAIIHIMLSIFWPAYIILVPWVLIDNLTDKITK